MCVYGNYKIAAHGINGKWCRKIDRKTIRKDKKEEKDTHTHKHLPSTLTSKNLCYESELHMWRVQSRIRSNHHHLLKTTTTIVRLKLRSKNAMCLCVFLHFCVCCQPVNAPSCYYGSLENVYLKNLDISKLGALKLAIL